MISNPFWKLFKRGGKKRRKGGEGKKTRRKGGKNEKGKKKKTQRGLKSPQDFGKLFKLDLGLIELRKPEENVRKYVY